MFTSDFKHKVLTAVRERYHDFGPTFASEKLYLEGLQVSKETLRQWMIADGLWKGRVRKQARIHQCRERRARFGELVQIDGSHHDWFEGRAEKCCLLVFIDDATSKILGLRFEESETTLGYMRLMKETIERYGRPLAYYNDRHSIFKTTREQNVDGIFQDTQLRRALRGLQIEDICAHSPQANVIKTKDDGETVGYVNRAQTGIFNQWLRNNVQLIANIERVNGSSDRPNMLMYVRAG